jgi:hypothetical protein
MDDPQRPPKAAQLRQPECDINDTQARHRASNEIVQEHSAQMKGIRKQDVVFPKLGPGHKDKKQANLKAEENKGNRDKTIHQWFDCRADSNCRRPARAGADSYVSLRGGLYFLNACSFSAELAHVIQLRPPDAPGTDNFDLVDDLGMEREYAFDAMSERNLADRKRRADTTVLLRNANALEDLDTFLIAFFDLHMDLNCIPRLESGEVRAKLLFLDHV